MPTTLEDLAERALGLPPDDRARLIERLLESFDHAPTVQTAWFDLAKERRDAVLAGQVDMLPGREAVSRVRGKLV